MRDHITYVQLRMRAADIKLIDTYRRYCSDLPSRPEAILKLMRIALDNDGHAAALSEEGLRP